MEQAYDRISRHPDAGSSRYAGELDIPGLRCGRVKKYPYLIFYVERNHDIDVWRVHLTSRRVKRCRCTAGVGRCGRWGY